MAITESVSPDSAVDPLILAVDVGTSSARALVYDAGARSVDGWEVHCPYQPGTTPDGGVEIDADSLFDLVAGAVDQILDKMRENSRSPAAVACDTFWHSILGVDSSGRPLTPIYTWADTRSRDAVRRLQSRVDEEAVYRRTGAVLHSSFPPAKLCWLQGRNPDLYKSVTFWMTFAEYLYLRLFGERKVSISMASASGLFNQTTCVWDAELLDVLSVSTQQLSPIAEFSDAARGLTGEFKSRWRSLDGIPWYLPLGDGACNNIGSGGVGRDWAVVMVGTSGALRVIHEQRESELPWGLWTYRVDRRRFVSGGSLSDGGNVFAWLLKNLRLDPTDALERELLEMKPDAHGLTMLPFLAGERSPDWNVDATAAIVGMRLDTSAKDIVRAGLESIAYRFATIYRILEPVIPVRRGIIGSGAGLIHSPAWMQIMADVLGKRLVASAIREASSRGAALLSLESMGSIPHLDALPVPLGTHFEPDKERHAVYSRAIQRQQKLYTQIIGPVREPFPAGAPPSRPQLREDCAVIETSDSHSGGTKTS